MNSFIYMILKYANILCLKLLYYKEMIIIIYTEVLYGIKEYLSNRKQYVIINGSQLNYQDIISSVLQGPVIVSISSLIYIHDLHKCILKYTLSISHFADGANIRFSFMSLSLIHSCPCQKCGSLISTQSPNLMDEYSEF